VPFVSPFIARCFHWEQSEREAVRGGCWALSWLCVLVTWGLAGSGVLNTIVHAQPVRDTTRVDSLRYTPDPRNAVRLPVPSLDTLAARRSRNKTEVEPDTTGGLVDRYVREPRRSGDLFVRPSPFASPARASDRGPTITLDSTELSYRIEDGDGPMRLGSDAYKGQRYRANARENWTTLLERREQQVDREGLGVRTEVPGAEGSAFATIFGSPDVDLRVDGQADINAGFEYSKNDQQGARTGDATQVDPNFKQDLDLGVTGTIGDKMQVNVDWDTNQQFDFQNQVKLEYTGYEDEILQKVEAGNVYMETPSQLINGGQSLFGFKSRFQFGNLSLTTIASKQEGQSNTLSIEGGSEQTEFDLKPTDYDEDTHFFLGYYFRNNWNRAHRDPTTITLFDNFDQITEVEVWKLRTSRGPTESNVRKAASVVDLGEPSELVREADAYTQTILPSRDVDQYDDGDQAQLRDGETSVPSFVSSELDQSLGSQDVVTGDFIRLERGRDFRLDERLGFLSLNQRLRPNEALAVAFRYRAGGEVRTVGDFSGDQGGTGGGVEADRLVLKLLRPTNPIAPGSGPASDPAAWFLEMRNIYRVGGRDFNADGFDLDIEYEPSGQQARTSIPDVTGQRSLLQVLGLDRLDQNGNRTPDNEFDFTQQTVDPDEGLLFFPYLQPFGDRIEEAAEEGGEQGSGESFAFTNLYRKKKSNAEKEDQQRNVYTLRGSFEGQAQGFYDLESFAGLVEGSVEVTSGGQTLQEGTDYVVDYQSGTVNITNQTFLADGRDINISYEENSISQLQQKSLLGARADWSLRDRYSLGATIMRLSENSPVDKFRIGEEAIKNTIWGVNGSMALEPQWLTEAVDALPLVETRANSRLELSGEFAQLRPDHSTTDAFERTVEEVSNSDQDDFAPDERNGVSYVDDFEGFENTFSLGDRLSAWQVSAAPDSISPALGGRASTSGARARTYWRGSFGWYQLNREIKEALRGKVAQRGPTEATRLLDVQEVFDRDTRGRTDPLLRTLDVYFDPWKRGPYNYTPNLDAFIDEPTNVWGGMTRQMPEGYTDFSVQNVEFVEFIVKVYPENGQITEGAKLFVDLGTISEDVVPNERLNTEDGLSTTFDPNQLGSLSRIAGSPSQNGNIDIRNDKTEDVGLDGLVSYDPDGPYDEGVLETNFYADFVERADSLRQVIGQLGLSENERRRLRAELARVEEDPSGDDYHHYENDRFFTRDRLFPRDVTLQERFSQYYSGHELDGFEPQRELAEDVSIRRGLSRRPTTEDLDGTGGNVNINNNYFQYAIPLDELEERAETNGGPTDYVVSKVGQERDWYKVRIPVEAPTRTVGREQDLTRIESMRLWTTGHAAPVTMRFASFELVGSQWRASESVAEEPVEDRTAVTSTGEGDVRVASVNTEEDPEYESPVGAVVSETRTSRGVQRRDREQALQLNVSELEPGQQRGIFKTFNQGLDLLKYSNVRAYGHVHGPSNSPQVKDEIREHLRFFVRIGANESTDYYEYEQRLAPSNVPGTEGASSLWPKKNEVNLLLSAFSQLKTARDQKAVSTDSVFSSDSLDFPLRFAPVPEATELRMRGTPSLNRIRSVVIGVRHVGPPRKNPPELKDLELWVNELRVSGFDERGGWATNTSASIELADLATVQGGFQRRTDGFGSLSSTLEERETQGSTSWNVRANLNLGHLLPRQQGWDIPVTMQVQSSRTSPRFDRDRGDVRVSEVRQQFDILTSDDIEARFRDRFPDRSIPKIRDALQDSVRRASQTYNRNRTVTAGFSKQESESWWMRQTIESLSLDFSFAQQTGRSPQRSVNDRWSWSGAFEYQLDFGQPRTVELFGFLPEAPLLSSLADLDFNYVPTSLSVGGNVDREVSTRRSRPSARADRSRPARVTSPFRENQTFTHRRNFNVQYDPFEFLNVSLSTNTRQSFNDVAGRTRRNIILSGASVRDTLLADVDPDEFFADPPQFLGDQPGAGNITREDLGDTVFIEERLERTSNTEVFQDLLFGDASPRTTSHGQRFSATLQLGITDREALNWLDLQDISYQSSYDWRNGSKGSLSGATVSNSTTVRTGVSLKPNRVWERFGFFRRMKQAQREAEREERSRNEGGSQSDADSDAEDGDGGFEWGDLPLPDPVGVLRRMALTVTDINDFTITYRGSRSVRATNVGSSVLRADTLQDVNTSHGLLDAIRGQGPSLGFRFGLSRSLDVQDDRAFPQGQSVADNLTNRHEFDGRTTLSPSSALQIDLNWNLEWRSEPRISFNRPRTGEGTETRRTTDETGSVRASVWAFGSYDSLVERQMKTLQENVGASGTLDAGEAALTNASVATDFRDAFLLGGGQTGVQGFAPFPMPGWNVRYSGISDWPLFRSIAQRASLTHSYNAEYQASFTSVSSAGEETAIQLASMDRVINYRRSDFELGSPRVQKQFQPFVGLDVTWPSNLQTSIEWNRRVTTSLRTASLRVDERKTSEISGRLSYSQRGLEIPLLPIGRIENRVQFSLTFTRQVNDEREFNLRPALEAAAASDFDFDPSQAREGDNVSIISETTRLTVTPQVSYSISNRVMADVQVEYEKFNGDSRQPSFTNVNGSFNVRINISQN